MEKCTDLHGRMYKSSNEQLDTIILCRDNKDTEWLKKAVQNSVLEVTCPSHTPKFPTEKWVPKEKVNTL